MGSVADRISNLDGYRALAVKYVLAIVFLIVLPILFGSFIASKILVFGIFALGYNLILGYGGELSFGHAAFFGIGGYATVLAARHLIPNLYAAIFIGVIVATIVSIAFGYLSLRRRGIYFAMITLALAQMVYIITLQWTAVTGGANGIALPSLETTLGPLVISAGNLGFYLFTAIMFTGIWIIIARIVDSPFGRILIAIRESEERARHLGYDVNNYLLIAFILSGAFSGFAGALYAALFVFVSPNILFWTFSGEVVLMTIMGGIGTLGGPVIGAAIFILLTDYLTALTQNWLVFFGIIIIAFVIGAPEGIYGSLRSYLSGKRQFDVQDLAERLDPRR